MRVYMKVIRWLDKHLEESLMIILLAVITTVMIFQVILRYLFRSPLFWAEEFCRYGLVWSTFISVGYCVRYNINLHVDLLDHIMPPKVKIVVQYLIKLICLLFYVVFFWGSWQYHMQSVAANQLSAAMQIPIALLQIVIVPGTLMGVLRQIQDIILYTRGLVGQNDESKGGA